MNVIDKYYDTYMPSSSVPRLTLSDFSSCGSLTAPLFKSLTTVVLFYVPECRFCQDFSGELRKFADEYASKIGATAAAIDMSLTNNYPLVVASENFPYKLGDVFPTIMIYYKGKPCSSYTSTRTATGLVDFITKNIGVGKTCSFKFVPCD